MTNYVMKMPASYVEVSREEMQYDGGATEPLWGTIWNSIVGCGVCAINSVRSLLQGNYSAAAAYRLESSLISLSCFRTCSSNIRKQISDISLSDWMDLAEFALGRRRR